APKHPGCEGRQARLRQPRSGCGGNHEGPARRNLPSARRAERATDGRPSGSQGRRAHESQAGGCTMKLSLSKWLKPASASTEELAEQLTKAEEQHAQAQAATEQAQASFDAV